MRRGQTLTPTRRLIPDLSELPYFSAVFCTVLVLLAGLGYLTITVAESLARERLIRSIETAERQGVNAMRRDARETLTDVTADLLVFRSVFQRELASEEPLTGSDQLLLDFMTNHRIYDQLRYIDAAGQERVRVDNEDKGPRLLPPAELQDKSQSSYFRNARGLAEGQLLISQIEPNREHGRVELPLNPVIRIIATVQGADAEQQGFVVLNYRARHLLNNMASIGNASLGSPLVISGRGLEALAALEIGTPEALRIAQGAPGFASSFPQAWAAMNRDLQGVVTDGQGGIMVFNRFYPAEAAIPPIFAEDVTWTLPREDDPAIEGGLYLVSHVDSDTLAGITRLGISQSGPVRALFLLIIAALAWLLALRMSNLRNDSARMHELATRDSLTGLLTRGEFERRLDAALAHAQRHQHAAALLYIDLDRFKVVNDTLGHAAGDELLRQVARVLTDTVRGSDFAGRVGGDEFAVTLTEVKGRSDTTVVAQKIRDKLRTVIELSGKRVEVGGSVGTATFPEDADSAEALFDFADNAMYREKPQRSAT